MHTISDTTRVYHRLKMALTITLMYFKYTFLVYPNIYVDAEIQILNDLCQVNKTNTEAYVAGKDTSCTFDVKMVSPSILVLNVDEEFINGSEYLYIENQEEGTNNCSKYISLDGHLKQCSAAFIPNRLRFHIRGYIVLQLQDGDYETLDSATIQTCLRENEPTDGNPFGGTSGVKQCGNVQSSSGKIICNSKILNPPELGVGETKTVLSRCDLKCSANCRCILSARHVTYCSDTDNKKGNNGLLLYPEEITYLNMSFSFIIDLSKGSFKGIKRLSTLNLSRNYLTSLRDGIFEGLQELTELDLSSNLIKFIDQDAFIDVPNLNNLEVENNRLTDINPATFRRLNKLVGLFLSSNNLQKLREDVFHSLGHLRILSLYNNSITTIESNTFSSAPKITAIQLGSNKISSLQPRAFNGLHLTYLVLSTNRLETIHKDAFDGLKSIEFLDLQENGLRKFPSACIENLRTAKTLNFSNNHLHSVPDLGPLKNATVIDLRNNELSYLQSKTFHGLSDATKVFVNEPVSCCFIHIPDQCIPAKPFPKYLTCGRLLPNTAIETFMWILGWSAVLGNLFVLVWRLQGKFEENQVQVLLITNLAASDLLMGVYMLTISSADIHFGRYFPALAEYWRTSRLCQFAGMLAVSSSEASVFFVTLISIDRYTRIAFPYARHQLRYNSARAISITLWVLSLAIGIVPPILLRINPELYDVSEVCINLPLVRKQVLALSEETYIDPFQRNTTRLIQIATGTKPSMYFSIVVYLGVNLLCFFIVLFCYVEIFWFVRRTGFTTNRRGRDKEIRMAMKMAVIVLTDFVCWMPIIILGILVQTGAKEVSPTVFAWIATFILPINSSVNPVLYTLSTAITAMLRRKNLKEDTHPEMQPMTQGRAAFDMSTVITRARADTDT